MPHIFLITFGEWVDQNLGIVAILVMNFIALVANYVTLRNQVKQIAGEVGERETEHDKLSEQVQAHLLDTSAHVNHLYMSTIEKDIAKMEGTMNAHATSTTAMLGNIFKEILHRNHPHDSQP